MGKMKQISILIDEAMASGALPDPTVKQPTVYVVMCDEKPVGVYVDRQTADYEMHLCIQGDYIEMGVVSKYELLELPLTTHRL
jgi:predicted NUDIX family phosphoesterase